MTLSPPPATSPGGGLSGRPRRGARDIPVRVAVISRSDVVRAGLVHLVAQLGSDAIVTEAVSLDGNLRGHDVAVYDLGAIADDADALRDLRGLVRSSTQVVGLVYDRAHRTEATAVAAGVPLVTLAVSPEELSAVLGTAIRSAEGDGESRTRQLPGDLSTQEFRVMELIGAGMTNEAIAKELHVSPNTIKTYIRVAYRKIEVTDRATAILWALRHGLAGGPDRR